MSHFHTHTFIHSYFHNSIPRLSHSPLRSTPPCSVWFCRVRVWFHLTRSSSDTCHSYDTAGIDTCPTRQQLYCAGSLYVILYSGKIWRALNLAKCRFFGFLIWQYRRHTKLWCKVLAYWRSFNLAVFTQNHHFTKLTPTKFSGIWYYVSDNIYWMAWAYGSHEKD